MGTWSSQRNSISNMIILWLHHYQFSTDFIHKIKYFIKVRNMSTICFSKATVQKFTCSNFLENCFLQIPRKLMSTHIETTVQVFNFLNSINVTLEGNWEVWSILLYFLGNIPHAIFQIYKISLYVPTWLVVYKLYLGR